MTEREKDNVMVSKDLSKIVQKGDKESAMLNVARSNVEKRAKNINNRRDIKTSSRPVNKTRKSKIGSKKRK